MVDSPAHDPDRLDAQAVRAEFPALHQSVHDRPLVYLDNASTTQKPRAVLDAMRSFYESSFANVHRGVHTLSQRATDHYEGARDTVQRFLGAAHREEIVFTRGTTEAINLVAQSWGRAHLGPGDRIVITELEHHSNWVPWMQVAEATGAAVEVVSVTAGGELDQRALDHALARRPKLVAVIHVSNALGTVVDVATITAKAKAVGATVLIDGAQAVPHLSVDVAALGCDFYAFSGHKVYGPSGIGVLYGRRERLESMPPWQGGGDMILSVSKQGIEYNDLPYRFEAGTPHIVGAVGLAAAIDWLHTLGIDRVAAHEARLLSALHDGLKSRAHIALVGQPVQRAGALSFNLGSAHPHDVGTLLDGAGVAVRTGHHCTQPLMERYDLDATVRASLAAYNTEEDLEAFFVALDEAQEVLCS